MKIVMAVLMIMLIHAAAQAAVVTETVDYTSNGTALQGYLAYDDAADGQRPGVLVVHEWWGLNDFPKERARELAALGYVAFAADMYGAGIVATDRERASELAGQFRGKWDEGGRALMRQRAQAGLGVLAGHPRVDPQRLGAVGYCFGGTTVLELAFSGADVAAVVSVHGSLTVPAEADLPRIKPDILILHGAADTGIEPATIADLQKALEQAGADWQFITFAGAKHGFSNPSNEAAYQETAARRSWEYMKAFFAEVLQPQDA